MLLVRFLLKDLTRTFTNQERKKPESPIANKVHTVMSLTWVLHFIIFLQFTLFEFISVAQI